MLGRPLSAVVRDFGPLDLSRCDPDTFSRLVSQKPRVAALVTGAWGDCGMTLPLYHLLPRPGSPGATKDSAAFLAAVRSRQVFRSHEVHSVGIHSLMAMCLVVDARQPLPLFFPYGRNEDALWAQCLRVFHPGLTLVHPAVALGHDPAAARPSGLDLGPAKPSSPWQGVLDQVLAWLVQAGGPPRPGVPEASGVPPAALRATELVRRLREHRRDYGWANEAQEDLARRYEDGLLEGLEATPTPEPGGPDPLGEWECYLGAQACISGPEGWGG